MSHAAALWLSLFLLLGNAFFVGEIISCSACSATAPSPTEQSVIPS